VPELPEVEVASRQLRAWLRGHRIVEAHAARSRIIRGQAPARFARLAGRALRGIERRGKWMLLDFDGGESLLSHLGMTGKWIRRRAADAPPSHVRASLVLAGEVVIDYRDPRLFGRLVCGTADGLRALPAIRQLGPDPLGGIDLERLHRVLSSTRRSLKEALMDQRTLAGLGNIQVAEALHRAGLHPERLGPTLALEETQRLVDAIAASLAATLDVEDGDEPITYVEEGGANTFLVYDRAGEVCRTCGKARIERIVQGGRSTFFCSYCQPASGNRTVRKPAGKSAAKGRTAAAVRRKSSPAASRE
jgi:formamidopyrimidine-DNA glycosylase